MSEEQEHTVAPRTRERFGHAVLEGFCAIPITLLASAAVFYLASILARSMPRSISPVFSNLSIALSWPLGVLLLWVSFRKLLPSLARGVLVAGVIGFVLMGACWSFGPAITVHPPHDRPVQVKKGEMQP